MTDPDSAEYAKARLAILPGEHPWWAFAAVKTAHEDGYALGFRAAVEAAAGVCDAIANLHAGRVCQGMDESDIREGGAFEGADEAAAAVRKLA